jgi:hypothetical protein
MITPNLSGLSISIKEAVYNTHGALHYRTSPSANAKSSIHRLAQESYTGSSR